jgi:NAD(P)-dependent dehydrogenase (short-subunit alcohol dehydrogenase family)
MNNVGDIATDQESWKEIDEKIIDRVLAVDIKGTMLMIHEMGTRMLERGTATSSISPRPWSCAAARARRNMRPANTASSG